MLPDKGAHAKHAQVTGCLQVTRGQRGAPHSNLGLPAASAMRWVQEVCSSGECAPPPRAISAASWSLARGSKPVTLILVPASGGSWCWLTGACKSVVVLGL
jgi:hypothetical protein